MPALTSLVNLISLDVTNKLVYAGYTYQTLTITNVTNASPMVVTTSTPHNFIPTLGASVVILGVLGSTTANGTWYAIKIDELNIALYAISSTGVTTASVSNSAYISGGTVQTAFTSGGIELGQIQVETNVNSPRCVFIPKTSRFGPRSNPNRQAQNSTVNAASTGLEVKSYNVTIQGQNYSAGDTVTVSAPDLPAGVAATATVVVDAAGHITRLVPITTGSGYIKVPTILITTSTGTGFTCTANLGRNPESLAQLQQRALWTEFVTFEVQVWMTAASPSYEADFDACQVVYQQVMASAWLLASGQVTLSSGKWLDQIAGQVQMTIRGHVYSFSLEIATPILDQPTQFANPQTRGSLTNQIIAIDTGTIETGWSGLT